MYFDLETVEKEGFFMNFITSFRGGGKTFGTLKYCFEKYLESGDQFVYLRETEAQLDKVDENLLTQLQDKGYFLDKKFSYSNNRLMCDGKTVGYVIAVSTAYKLKSVPFTKVKRVIYDEFISESGRYTKNIVEKTLSLLETIGRDREYKVYLLANQNTIYNPFYLYFKIKPVGKSFTRYRKMGVLIYEFKSTEFKEHKLKTDFGKLISQTKYGEFLLDNENISDDYAFIDTLEGVKKYPIVNLILEGNNIVIYECEIDGQFGLYMKKRASINDLPIVNFDKMFLEGARLEFVRNNNIYKKIVRNSSRGSIRFDDIPTRHAIEKLIF